MDSSLQAQVPHPTVKHFGFKVRDLLPPPRPGDYEPAARAAEVAAESWALPVPWRQAPSPFQATPDHSSLLSCASEGFKSFKDCCEAGSFSLTSAKVLPQSGHLEVAGAAHTCAAVRSLVKAVAGGLRACQQPEPSTEGLGGTYFFQDELGRRKAIVKPCDEEPLAPNNPKGFVGRALGDPGLKPTVRVGEAAMREVAAYLLDHENFARVPPTVLVRVTHGVFHIAQQPQPSQAPPESAMSCSQASAASVFAMEVVPQSPPCKLASLQEFIPHRSDASELGFSRFSVQDVHRIGILDLRLFNTDRHAGNMLVRRRPAGSMQGPLATAWLPDQLELIPIDHGFCLPEALEAPYLEWLHWPQAMIPFDEEELAYIARLDARKDVEFLRRELPWLPEGSLRTLEVATMLLKTCAAAGLTLAEIGGVASRPLVGLDEEESQLEAACLAARARVDALPEDECSSDCEEEEAAANGCGSPMDDSHTVSTASGVSGSEGMQFYMEPAPSGDDLLFDLDEEGPMPPTPPPGPRRVHSLLQPRVAPAALRTVASEAVLRRQQPDSPLAESQEAGPAAGMARSLATGMLQQRAARRPASRAYRSASTLKATPKRRLRQAYPPPVVGTHQSGLSGAFAGLDAAGWADYLQHLEALFQEALEEGAWKQQPEQPGKGKVALGCSCPRF